MKKFFESIKKARCHLIRFILFFIILLVIPSVSFADADMIFKENSKAVVVIVTYNESGEATSQGSGFIVSASGAVVTNYHVIEEAKNITVETGNKVLEVEGILHMDKENDLVILKAKGNNLPVVKLGDISKAIIGEKVYVISSPQGLENTISDGILSGIREISPKEKILQITAPVSPGSSGGPVFNKNGEVIGIATFLITESQNLNFAMPVNLIKGKISTKKITALKNYELKDSEKPSLPSSQEPELFTVTQNGKKGYIDKTGKIVINPQFDAAQSFSEGLACVNIGCEKLMLKGGKWGYIDKTGQYVINPQFDGDFDSIGFSEGLACVRIGDKYGYINKTGQIVINPQFDWARSFSGGLACVKIGDKYGYINKTGKIVINPQFDIARSFSGGLASVAIGGYKEKVDRLNEVMFGYKCGYIDKTGQYVINPQFDYASSFSEGLALVQIGGNKDMYFADGKYGYINKTGQIVINPQFDSAESFSEGLARVSIGHKSGYINKTGQIVINPQFDWAESFSGGLACVKIGLPFRPGKYGYIDKTGQYVINPQFDYASSFSKGLAYVKIGDKSGYIDRTGKYVWNPSE